MDELRDRYSLGKTALADRLKHCSIHGTRTGNKSFVNSGQIEVLDSLDRHLKQGMGMDTFHSPYADYVEAEIKPVQTESTAIVPQQTFYDQGETIDLDPYDTLDKLEKLLNFLEKAADKRWCLPTSTIKEIVGAAPRSPSWCRYGFEFKPSGSHGQETAWLVTKVKM